MNNPEYANKQRIEMLRYHIEKYTNRLASLPKGDWQETYFRARIQEAELEIRERQNLVTKVNESL